MSKDKATIFTREALSKMRRSAVFKEAVKMGLTVEAYHDMEFDQLVEWYLERQDNQDEDVADVDKSKEDKSKTDKSKAEKDEGKKDEDKSKRGSPRGSRGRGGRSKAKKDEDKSKAAPVEVDLGPLVDRVGEVHDRLDKFTELQDENNKQLFNELGELRADLYITKELVKECLRASGENPDWVGDRINDLEEEVADEG